MRIAHIESSLNWGGQELRIVEQMEWLIAHGHATWLLARPQSAILKEARKRKLPYQELDIRGSANPIVIRQLVSFLKANQVQVLDAHSNRDAAYAMFARWMTQTKILRSRHVTTPAKRDALHRFVWRYGNDGIVTTARKVNEHLIEQGLSQAERIYTARAGVDAQRYSPDIDSAALKQSLGIPAAHRVIANIGMIRQDKGQLDFLRACELIAEQVSDVTFVQIGEATADTLSYERKVLELHSRLRHKNRIHFLGYKSNIETYQAFVDIVMICSVGTEAQTRLVSQAFLMRNNVVATQVGGLPEMIQHGETGLLCEPRNPKALAQAAISLLADHALSERLKDRARAHALQEMTFDQMMEGMLKTYSRVIAKDYPIWNQR